MKKKLLICISTIFILGAFSQIDSEKVNLHHKNYNNINVTNPTNLNFAGGDDYLWSFDISDTTMISTAIKNYKLIFNRFYFFFCIFKISISIACIQ